MVLLVDSDLMEFPLESLELLGDTRIRSVSRDFSLQMFYDRMKTHLVENTNGKKNVNKKRIKIGPVRDSNPGPLAPEARIIPLDQQADARKMVILVVFILIDSMAGGDKKKSADKSMVQPPTILADVTNIKCKKYSIALKHLECFCRCH